MQPVAHDSPRGFSNRRHPWLDWQIGCLRFGMRMEWVVALDFGGNQVGREATFRSFGGSRYSRTTGPNTLTRRMNVLRGYGSPRRYEIHLFFNGSLFPAAALQNALCIFDHSRVPAKICDRVFRRKSPRVGVFADQIVHASGLTFPGVVLPRPADCGNVGQPGNIGGDARELVAVAEFAGTAGAVDQKKIIWERRPGVLRLMVKRPDKTHKRRDAGHRCEQKMVWAPAAGVECKTALGGFSQCNFVAHLKGI